MNGKVHYTTSSGVDLLEDGVEQRHVGVLRLDRVREERVGLVRLEQVNGNRLNAENDRRLADVFLDDGTHPLILLQTQTTSSSSRPFTLMPRSRLLGRRNFRVRFSEFRVLSVPVNSEVGTRKFIEIQVNK